MDIILNVYLYGLVVMGIVFMLANSWANCDDFGNLIVGTIGVFCYTVLWPVLLMAFVMSYIKKTKQGNKYVRSND